MGKRRIVVPLIARNPNNPKKLMEAVEDVTKHPQEKPDEEIQETVELPELVPDEIAESILVRQLSSKLDLENKKLDTVEKGADLVELPAIQERAEKIVKERASLLDLIDTFNQKAAESGGKAFGKAAGAAAGTGLVGGIVYVIFKLVEAFVK